MEVINPLDSAPATDTQTNFISVKFVGLECQVRQEKVSFLSQGDEIYGTVSCIVPVQNKFPQNPPVTIKFPDAGAGVMQMGADNLRIVQFGELLYQDSPNDLKIACLLVEHDDADVPAIKEAAKQAILTSVQSLVGAATGIDAEKLGASENFLGGIVEFVLQGILNLLGGKDDAYNPGVLLISHKELQEGNFTRRELIRSDDPKRVSYTHSLIVTGVDDGGDTGVYAFYFDVQKVSL